MTVREADEESARKLALLIGGVMALAGVALLAAAVIAGIKSYRYTANAVKTQGTVTEMVRQGSVTYPRYQFIVGGVSHTAVGRFGSSTPIYRIGDTIEIEYVRDRPADSRIASWGDRGFLTLWLSIAGGALTAIGLAFRRKVAETTESVND